MKGISAALVAATLVVGACSSPGLGEPDPRLADARSERRAEKRATPDVTPGEPGAKRPRSPSGKHTEGAPGNKTRTEAADPRGSVTPAGEANTSPRSEGSKRSGPARSNGAAARPNPRSGRYMYAQQGWEEFCAGTCDRSDLPPSQAIDTRVTPHGRARKVVTESKASENRSVTTTYRLTSDAMAITRVELHYGTFSNTYRPSPSVRSLEFPLANGRRWSGSWSAETSGDYSAEVIAREALVVDGRRIPTFKIDSVTHFSGDFEGSMTATIWIDPRTTTLVRSSGKIRLSTRYGRFNSDFDTMLIEGPGY